MNQARDVLLGSEIDLHDGVHGGLQDNPPASVRYCVRRARHFYAFRGGNGGSPHRDYHLAECVDFGPGSGLVHSARWPVLNRPAWVTDMDDFGYPVLVGRAMVNPEVRSRLRLGSQQFVDKARRAEKMLGLYAHPSCKAVIFRTEQGLQMAEKQLSQMRAGALGDAFLGKASVVYPGQVAAEARQVQRKWNGSGTTRVVFCGRDHNAKNGALALRVFRRLVSEMPHVEFTYLGETPPSWRDEHGAPRLRVRGVIPRGDVLRIFADSHILFHPSKFESVGIVLLEAAAAGMAIVAATGGEMTHMKELFGEGGAILLDRDTVDPPAEEGWFYRRLRTLLDDLPAAATLGLHNHAMSTNGKLSVTCRNAKLSSIYEGAVLDPSRPLRASQACHQADEVLVAMESRAVLTDQVEYLRSIGITRQHVNILG